MATYLQILHASVYFLRLIVFMGICFCMKRELV